MGDFVCRTQAKQRLASLDFVPGAKLDCLNGAVDLRTQVRAALGAQAADGAQLRQPVAVLSLGGAHRELRLPLRCEDLESLVGAIALGTPDDQDQGGEDG